MNAPTMHHVGFVVASIPDVVERFARSISATWDGQIFHDPLQKVRVTFLETGGSQTASVELIEPADEGSPVTAFLQRGGGLHHVCYEVDSIEEQMRISREARAVMVKPPLPAVAFNGRRIFWVMTPDRLLVEYLER